MQRDRSSCHVFDATPRSRPMIDRSTSEGVWLQEDAQALGSKSMTALSILDLATVVSGGTPSQALEETTLMAQSAERLGFERLWVAEHHGMPGVASSAPAVLLAHLAASTSTIRVGAGGVMLPNHAPLVVAEQFGTLEALHHGRIDLGLGRAPGTTPQTARALGRRNSNHFPDDVVELIGCFTGASQHLAMPGRGLMPQIWLLGSSTYSAQLAGMLGLPFSFAYHFSAENLDAAVHAYRSTFEASSFLDSPRLMITVAALCAPSTEEALWLAGPSRLSSLLIRTGRSTTLMSPEEASAFELSDVERAEMDRMTASHLVGEPDPVVDAIFDLVERTGANEVMLSTRVHDIDQRIRSIELISSHWMAAVRPSS
jgi:luciferase family oxidoreductase group 1